MILSACLLAALITSVIVMRGQLFCFLGFHRLRGAARYGRRSVSFVCARCGSRL